MPYDNSGSGPLRVPGFSMEIDADLKEDSLRPDGEHGCYFADGIEGWSGQRLTVREIAMLNLMESITDKPDWDKKVFDDAIVDKWHDEAVALPLISEPAWKWVLAEIRDKANAFKESRRVLALDSNARCVKSDVLVGADLRAELIAGVAELMSIPDSQKDWHPGSNNQVLNLVHPSLYPLVYGRTRVLTNGGRVALTDILASCGQGEVAAKSEHTFDDNYAWSARFQWLPCEVEFSSGTDGETDVRITSYINNLHPNKHRGLYRTIEKIISLSVPLWNDVVMYEEGVRTARRIVTYGAEWEPKLPEWAQYSNRPTKTTDPNFSEIMQWIREYLALPDLRENDPDDEPEFDEDNLDDVDDEGEEIDLEQKWKRIRYVAHPEPGQSFTYEEWKDDGVQRPIISSAGGYDLAEPSISPKQVSLEKWFRAQGLQVIVKLASIELTPENPKYPGGSWHLEGMKNEHIVATSIYYYDVDNTTSSHLSFRQGAALDDTELQYEQDDHEPLSTVFGTGSMRDEPAVQVIGRISTPEGRLLAFPNTLQHKVEPFELSDKTKPGHRRFLVLWLVDPHFRICSTRNVPPQQHDWWAEEALDVVDFRPLPQEVIDMVKGEIGDWPMGLDEAKALRLELMAERTRATESVESTFEEYNLCEH
ncbi:hypothetical protein BR93DRAFT_916535 [Coniochaeta sp. PMI_546]|nr:hypothetical protein BR93DRAFT_916535 [Coniochaeta sp. PMI_546]